MNTNLAVKAERRDLGKTLLWTMDLICAPSPVHSATAHGVLGV
jgi:hypothetical protein